MTEPKLHLSECFVSLQGEGPSAGVPAVFWRFKGCVLECTFCDTLEVWKKGNAYTFSQLFTLFSDAGHFSDLHRGAHLVITGGDPLLQGDRIAEFLSYCDERGVGSSGWFIECENQGTLPVPVRFLPWINQWNISPKLSNSGMSRERRIVPHVMASHVARTSSTFKFPIRDEHDLAEVLDFQEQFHISRGKIYLMPICSSIGEHRSVGAAVAALCIKHSFQFSPRLQLALWDKTVGV